MTGPRTYDPLVGRFFQPDPLGSAVNQRGVVPFNYAGSNPMRKRDQGGYAPIEVAPVGAASSGDMGVAQSGVAEAAENLQTAAAQAGLDVDLASRAEGAAIVLVDDIKSLRGSELKRGLMGVGFSRKDARNAAVDLRHVRRGSSDPYGLRAGRALILERRGSQEALRQTAGHETAHLLSSPSMPTNLLIEGAANYYSDMGYGYPGWDAVWQDLASRDPRAAAAVFFSGDVGAKSSLEAIVNADGDRWQDTRTALASLGVLSAEQATETAASSNWEGLLQLSDWGKSNMLSNDPDFLKAQAAAAYLIGVRYGTVPSEWTP